MTTESDAQLPKYNRFTAPAIQKLQPKATFTVTASEIIWQGSGYEIPSEAAIFVEQQRLQAEWDALEYQRKREREYPDPRLYLDAVVKGDQEAMQAYIDACLAVKAKYPKPV